MNNLSKIIVATSAGLIVGGSLGLLFAPVKGEKTRKDISRKGKRLLKKINDRVGKEKLSELKKEFEDHLSKINEKIKDFANIE